MIVGGYTLDLYCDNEKPYPDGIHPFKYFPQEFVGETRQECAKEARQVGWKLNFNKRTAICPICNNKKYQTRKSL